MIKPDELWFLRECWRRVRNHGLPNNGPSETPRDLINEVGFPLNHKRAWFLLQKWCDKGWYDYGVTLDLGWITEKGQREISEIIIDERMADAVDAIARR